MRNTPVTSDAEGYLTIGDFASKVGAHPNTVRKLIRSGDIPYLVENTLSGELLSPEAPRPVRFRYLIDPAAIQHVVAALNPPIRSQGNVQMLPAQPPNTVTLPIQLEELNRLKREVATLQAENTLLRHHTSYLENLTDRLIPLLPPADNTIPEPVVNRRWWHFWGRRQGS